jgi:large subunit ribosomal protein L1
MANEETPAAPAAETAAPTQAPEQTKATPAEASVIRGEAETTSKKKKRPGSSPRRGKKLRNHLKNLTQKVRSGGTLPVKSAMAMLRTMKRAKFDETVEIHVNLGIDPAQSDQMVRGSVSLPHGIGKTVRVAVFCQNENVAKAKEAGAVDAGSADLITKVSGGWMDFDVAIATQDMMGQVSRLGKVLGPRGLMPSPKAGTVVPVTGDVAAVVREFIAGKVEYRSDKSGQIHAGVGKMSFDDEKLIENITTFVETVRAAKPSGVKGNYINGIVLSSTMSPGLRITV